MHLLPNPPRTEGFSDPEAVIDAMRRWFWALAQSDFDFSDPPRWTHDDNRQAQTYGFMILAVPEVKGALRYAVVPLTRHTKAQDVEHKIVKLAPIDPLCAKALGILTAQKLAGGA